MNILLIEDEKLASDRLTRMIKELLPQVHVHEALRGVLEAEAWLQTHVLPDLVMLDIHLNDGTAFDLLERRSIDCPIIFTTAYEEFAFKAHKVNSIDYLLKPVKEGDLKAALAKHQKLKEHFSFYAPSKTEAAAATVAYKTRFMIRMGDHIRSVPVEEVSYFYTEHKATWLKAKDGRQYPLDQNLDALEAVLHPQTFFRINRQFIISLEAIADMKAYTKGRVVVRLQPAHAEQPVVSAERSATFKAWLDGA